MSDPLKPFSALGEAFRQPVPVPLDPAEKVLSDWWRSVVEEEISSTVPKAVEYGPNSMIEVGRAMGRMSHRDLSDQEAIEVACMFYICGKLGRWVDAVAHGKTPSDDTLHDIGVYIKMAQRNRAVGSWPGVDLE
jgi:hypothetical protein